VKKAESQIVRLLRTKGPSTGFEIKNGTGLDNLLAWRTCKTSEKLQLERVGTRYLRLDRRVDGFARLSPSILREFLTYTVVGLKSDQESLHARAADIRDQIEEISRLKLELARRMAAAVAEKFGDAYPRDQVAFILAGDIVYNMAHDVPRPERSTGKMVRGSDIDLVVIVGDEVPEAFFTTLDDYIYREKYTMLVSPSINEEADYIVKRLGRVREQALFDTFKHMVACKILDEGILLHGSEGIFHSAKSILADAGVLEKLAELEQVAEVFRRNAEASLLKDGPKTHESEYLFYSAEESEEFE